MTDEHSLSDRIAYAEKHLERAASLARGAVTYGTTDEERVALIASELAKAEQWLKLVPPKPSLRVA